MEGTDTMPVIDPIDNSVTWRWFGRVHQFIPRGHEDQVIEFFARVRFGDGPDLFLVTGVGEN